MKILKLSFELFTAHPGRSDHNASSFLAPVSFAMSLYLSVYFTIHPSFSPPQLGKIRSNRSHPGRGGGEKDSTIYSIPRGGPKTAEVSKNHTAHAGEKGSSFLMEKIKVCMICTIVHTYVSRSRVGHGFSFFQKKKGGLYHRQLVGMLAFGFCNPKKKSNQIKPKSNHRRLPWFESCFPTFSL